MGLFALLFSRLSYAKSIYYCTADYYIFINITKEMELE